MIRIGERYWPLSKRICCGTDRGPAGEPIATSKGLSKRKDGPKVWQWNECLQFRGFRLWIQFTHKDHPKLFENVPGGENKEALPGMVDEIISPNTVKYSFAGVVSVRLKVEPFPAEGEPPLSPEEIKEAGKIMDFLNGVPPPAEPKGKRPPGKRMSGGKKHNLTPKDKDYLGPIILAVIRGNKKNGEKPLEGKAARDEVLRRAKEHHILKQKILAEGRTLDGWIEDVRLEGRIRGALT